MQKRHSLYRDDSLRRVIGFPPSKSRLAAMKTPYLPKGLDSSIARLEWEPRLVGRI